MQIAVAGLNTDYRPSSYCEPRDCGTGLAIEEQVESLTAEAVFDVAAVAGEVDLQSSWETTELERLAYSGKPALEVAAETEQAPEKASQKGCKTAVIAAAAALVAQGDQKDCLSSLWYVETERAEAWEVRQRGRKYMPQLLAW